MLCFAVLFLGTLPAAGASQKREADQAKGSSDREPYQKLADRATQAQRKGRSEEAIRLYLKVLQARPEWADGWRNVGILLANRKEYARANAAFKNLLDVQPKNGAAWALLGLCEYEQGRYDEAYKDIQRGRTFGIGNSDLEKVAAYHAALVLIQKGEFPAAQALLARLSRLGVDDPDLITAFGLAAMRIPTVPEKVDADQLELVRRVGQIDFQALHDPVTVNKTVAAYEALLRERPADPRLHFAFGNYLFNLGHYDRGLQEMTKVLELDSNDLMALLQMALTYLKVNEPELALPYAEKAVQLYPGLVAPHYALGSTLFKLGQNDRAVSELKQAVKLEPDSSKAHYALSQVLMRLGRKDDAAKERKIFAELKQAEEAAEKGSQASSYNAGNPTEIRESHPQR